MDNPPYLWAPLAPRANSIDIPAPPSLPVPLAHPTPASSSTTPPPLLPTLPSTHPLAPPTPAPSPRPTSPPLSPLSSPTSSLLSTFPRLPLRQQRAFLSSLVPLLSADHLLLLSALVTPRLKRDFLRDLPIELALHVLRFLDDPRALARASQVSRTWRALLSDEHMWREMCRRHGFDAHLSAGDIIRFPTPPPPPVQPPTLFSPRPVLAALTPPPSTPTATPFSYRRHFIRSYLTDANWRRGGRLLITHPPSPETPHPAADNLAPLGAVPGIPLIAAYHHPHPHHPHHHHPPPPGPPPPPPQQQPQAQATENVVTSLALDEHYIVVGLANCRVHVYSAHTGLLTRTLVGHESGVWCLGLVSATASPPYAEPPPLRYFNNNNIEDVDMDDGAAERERDRPRHPRAASAPNPDAHAYSWAETQARKMADPCGASRGWGNPGAIVVSGGCDRDVRVWDVETGECLHILPGHTSTIRCLKVLHDRPIAVTGSRDGTLRVWDVRRGVGMHVLAGHQHSVRCLEVWGGLVVSGSYDCTARLWDVETGECLQVYRGHYHQIYAIAFDGERVVTGSLDSTVRVWHASTAETISLLTGHTSLVGQLQLTSTHLATGGSDGRVILYTLPALQPLHRLLAHDNSVTCLQFDHRFLVSGGNDGRVKLYDVRSGGLVRELTEPCEAIWRVSFGRERCVVLCKREGRTVMEVLNFRPEEGEVGW